MRMKTRLEKVKVLYVEDDDNARDALASMLKTACRPLVYRQRRRRRRSLFQTYQPEIIIGGSLCAQYGRGRNDPADWRLPAISPL